MKKKFYLVSAAFAGVVLFAVGMLFLLDRSMRRNRSAVPEGVSAKAAELVRFLQPGDLILRSGNTIWSFWISECAPRDRSFTHAGIIIKKSGAFHVIHCEADGLTKAAGVYIQPLAGFLMDGTGIGIYRLKDRKAAARLPAEAEKYLDCPFDFSFDLSTRDRLYCTEFVYLSLLDSGCSSVKPYYSGKLGKYMIPVDSFQDPEFFTFIHAVRLGKAASERGNSHSVFF